LIHLDTSFLIRALVRGSGEDAALRGWLNEQTPLAISSIAWTEFLCGPLDIGPHELARSLFREIVPFTSNEASIAAQLFNDSGRRRGTLTDCMVAATAISTGATLATSNGADFKRFVRLGLTMH
jgi:predicted nucleic acid-binding protein